MGYTRVIQYGDRTEIYKYQKFYEPRPKKPTSELEKKRAAARKQESMVEPRTKYSLRRTVRSFFRLVHHNTCRASTVVFATFTLAYELTHEEASRSIAHFCERLKKKIEDAEKLVSLSYISVPEFGSQTNRLHYHVLFFNLPTDWVEQERKTRNFQRLYRKGFVDFCLASQVTTGIAGYMAKYLSKNFANGDIGSRRGYNCSRSIEKIASAGINEDGWYMGMIQDIVIDADIDESGQYDTIWFGQCNYTRYRIDRDT